MYAVILVALNYHNLIINFKNVKWKQNSLNEANYDDVTTQLYWSSFVVVVVVNIVVDVVFVVVVAVNVVAVALLVVTDLIIFSCGQ